MRFLRGLVEDGASAWPSGRSAGTAGRKFLRNRKSEAPAVDPSDTVASKKHCHSDGRRPEVIGRMMRAPVRTAYYVLTHRETTYPRSWRWHIVRRGRPMGVVIEGRGFHSYEAARFAGRLALEDFLKELRRQRYRDDG